MPPHQVAVVVLVMVMVVVVVGLTDLHGLVGVTRSHPSRPRAGLARPRGAGGGEVRSCPGIFFLLKNDLDSGNRHVAHRYLGASGIFCQG